MWKVWNTTLLFDFGIIRKKCGIKIIMFASHLCHYFEPPLFSRCSGDDATSNLGLERIPGSKVILLPDICTLPFLLFDEFNFIYGVPSTYIISGLRAPVVVNSEGDDADNDNDDDKSLCLELDASSFLGLAGCSTVRTQAGLSWAFNITEGNFDRRKAFFFLFTTTIFSFELEKSLGAGCSFHGCMVVSFNSEDITVDRVDPFKIICYTFIDRRII